MLELCTSEYLYLRFPEYDEGAMTRLRAQEVCESALYEVARDYDLGALLLLGRGEDHSGGREKPSILSDAVEAVIGALYIDGGMEVAKEFIMRFVHRSVEDAMAGRLIKDHKTMLRKLSKAPTWAVVTSLTAAAARIPNKSFPCGAVAGETCGAGRPPKQEPGSRRRVAALIEFALNRAAD